ncbi:hypothetical protein HY745_12600, partial [Candidatus Desantisbacteria bacterium]|nr:hypothetical protein [Candidatus Desantisbacteria bacterium]
INGLDIDYFKIMDNHIHIIFIFKNCARPLGRVVSAMKYNITKIVKSGSSSQDNGECNSPATHAMHGTNDVAAGLPSSVNAANDKSPSTIWQWNYYEHIIRNEKSLRKIREYIDNNPLVENINWKDLDE